MDPTTNVLFTSDLWLRALERYGKDTHLSVTLFDADEQVVFGPVHPTPLFQLFQEKGYDPGIFAECARRCLAQTESRPAVMVSEVYGLAVVGTSLVLEGKIVGAAVGGYAFVDFTQLSEIQRLARDAGIKFELLWQIAREQKPVPQRRLMQNGDLLQVLGDALLRENYRARQYEETALKLEEAVRARDRGHEELQQTAAALRKSEAHYRTLFDLGPMGVYSCDASGVIQEFNRRATELWGRTPILGDTDERFCGSFKLFRSDGSLMPHEQCAMAEVSSGRISEMCDGEVIIERPDGSRITVIVNIRPLKNEQGEVAGTINCFYDISQRKRAEDALQRAHDELECMVQRRTASLRQLSSHLQHVQDDERRRIARELHDSAGQYLAALKMNLAQLEQPNLTNAKRIFAESNEMLDKCLAEIRTMSYLLHPPMLDESGLAAAASWYVEGFARRSNVQTDIDISPKLERLPRDVEMVLFRALQESLTNVHRHSHSPKVDIRVTVEKGQATLAVRDYGRGFGSEQLETFRGGSNLGVGLAGMRERVNELGGVLEILAEEPGTSITVTLPIAKAEARTARTMENSAERGSAD